MVALTRREVTVQAAFPDLALVDTGRVTVRVRAILLFFSSRYGDKGMMKFENAVLLLILQLYSSSSSPLTLVAPRTHTHAHAHTPCAMQVVNLADGADVTAALDETDAVGVFSCVGTSRTNSVSYVNKSLNEVNSAFNRTYTFACCSSSLRFEPFSLKKPSISLGFRARTRQAIAVLLQCTRHTSSPTLGLLVFSFFFGLFCLFFGGGGCKVLGLFVSLNVVVDPVIVSRK